MGLPVRIWSTPVEIPSPIPFEQDTLHHSYDPEFANRFWRIVVDVQRVFAACRCAFIGKCSPVHFFWGSFDLAVTRFSGKPAPTRGAAVHARGLFARSGEPRLLARRRAALYPAFYAYAVPEPEGFKTARAEPAEGFLSRRDGRIPAALRSGALRAFARSGHKRVRGQHVRGCGNARRLGSLWHSRGGKTDSAVARLRG